MFFGALTIGINGFSMVFGSCYHRVQWFSMVRDHWSKDGMVSMDCNALISDGLKLLDTIAGDTGSLKSLGSVSQLLGVGSQSLGATGGASAIKTLETPELRAQLKKKTSF